MGGEIKHLTTNKESASHYHKIQAYERSDVYSGISDTGGADKVLLISNTAMDYINIEPSENLRYGQLFAKNDSFSGGNQPHNNMPPYLVISIWKRVS